MSFLLSLLKSNKYNQGMNSQLPQVRQREPEVRQREPEAQNPDDEPLEVETQEGDVTQRGPPELAVFVTNVENLRNRALRRFKLLREFYSSYKLADLKEVIEDELQILEQVVAALLSSVVFIDRKLGIARQQPGIAFRQRPLQQ